MQEEDRIRVKKRSMMQYLFTRFRTGILEIKSNSKKKSIFFLYLIATICIYLFRDPFFIDPSGGMVENMKKSTLDLGIPFCGVVGLLAIIFCFGMPKGSSKAKEALLKAGVTNHAGEAPILLNKRADESNSNTSIWDFASYGIPLSTWEDRKAEIETALNISIAKMEWAEGKSIIRIYSVEAKGDLPPLILWRNKFLSEEDFVLTLGMGLTGPITVNLAHIPHILLGGSTGSGKSVLLKLLLMQAVKKGAQVCIADFKGGVDFLPIWHEKCWMCFEETELRKMLDMMVRELEDRKKLFKYAGYPNIGEYIGSTGNFLPRYIFACDEVAELLDTTGRTKEEKAIITQITKDLTYIARQGRAFGIHLIFATQRPDATIIPGQIKNNIDFRACGRADNVLSCIILDNGDAADQIPKESRGRFLLHDGTIFQAFFFDERTAFEELPGGLCI